VFGEIDRCFAESHCTLLYGIDALNRASDSFGTFDILKPFTELYSANVTKAMK